MRCRAKWTTTTFPSDLFDEVRDFIRKHPELGYRSVAEFVRDAVREKLRRLREELERR